MVHQSVEVTVALDGQKLKAPPPHNDCFLLVE